MHRRSKLLLALLLPLLVWSQTPAPRKDQGIPKAQSIPKDQRAPEVGGFIFRAETRLVVLHASVMDRDKHFVTNLKRDAFKVFENNVEQTLKDCKREDVPISVGLIIDNSGSMRDKRERVNAAALAFVKASNREDEVFVVNFNDEAFLDQEFTNSQDLLQDALKKVDQRGGTAFYDALSMSVDHLKEKAKRDKKVLLLITDGEDNASQMTLEKMLRKVHESEVALFTVGLLNEEERRAARRTRRALTTLAEDSGGAAFFPKDASEVDEIARRIALDIRNQYILSYNPTNESEDGGFRQVKVNLIGTPKSYTVRTRTGYYARRTNSAQVTSVPTTPPPTSLRPK